MSAQVPDQQSARALIYRSYVSGDLASWQTGVDQLSAWCKAHPDDLEAHFEWSLAEYGLIGGRLSGEGEQLNPAVKELQARVEALLDRRPDWAAAHALLGGLYGMRVHLSPGTTLYYGPKSVSQIDRALEVDPNCPFAWIERGNTKFHAPAIFGGNTAKAVTCYARAAALFDTKPRTGTRHWMHLYALAWLGLAHEKNGDYTEAKAAYAAALSIEPGFRWVKTELMPALEARIKQN